MGRSRNRVDYYLRRRQKINERLYKKFDANNESIVSGLPDLPDRLIISADGSSVRSLSSKDDRINSYDNSSVESFEQFWAVNCELLGWLTLRTFYIGTAFLLVSISILMLSKLQKTYNNEFAGYLFCGFIFSSFFVTVLILFFIKYSGKRLPKTESMETFSL